MSVKTRDPLRRAELAFHKGYVSRNDTLNRVHRGLAREMERTDAVVDRFERSGRETAAGREQVRAAYAVEQGVRDTLANLEVKVGVVVPFDTGPVGTGSGTKRK